IEAAALAGPADDGIALTDVDHVAPSATVVEEAIHRTGKVGAGRVFGATEDAQELRPVVDGDGFSVAGGRVGCGTGQAGGTRPHRPDRPGAAGDLLDVDAGRGVEGHGLDLLELTVQFDGLRYGRHLLVEVEPLAGDDDAGRAGGRYPVEDELPA